MTKRDLQKNNGKSREKKQENAEFMPLRVHFPADQNQKQNPKKEVKNPADFSLPKNSTCAFPHADRWKETTLGETELVKNKLIGV